MKFVFQICLTVASSLLLSLFCCRAEADLTVSMTGTIAEGQLNGNNIDGESFEVAFDLVDGVDNNGNDKLGWFALNSARLTLGNGDIFDFDPDTTLYAQAYQLVDNQFAAGLWVPSDGINPRKGFGYVDDQPNPPNDFDADVFQAFTYSTFAGDFGDFNPEFQSGQIFENGNNILRIDSLGLAGASVTAVPEPNVLSFLGLSALMLVSSRRNRCDRRMLQQ